VRVVDLGEVERVLDALAAAGVRSWVLGGWGVDALAGRQTREHRDLDLGVDATDWERCLEVAGRLGYRPETDWWPVRVELVSPGGWLDLHPVRFDEHGDGVQAGPDGTTYAYPREHLTTGVLGGRVVPCISAAWQVRAHQGYEPRPQDLLDLAVLESLDNS
jgi:lincosamide nucleotidyltransferase A/C/D/E